MINIIIILLIFIGLIIHRYLSSFWEQGILPYAMGFLTFANLFSVLFFINYVWMFGFLVGIIFFALTYFQIIYASYLWPFLLPWLINMHKESPAIAFIKSTSGIRVNPIVYGAWSFIIIALGILTVSNFFISEYATTLKIILELFNGRYELLILLLIGSMAIGNGIRVYIMSRFLKKDE